MSDPYLILHKVRGKPAFDIAIKIQCLLCNSAGCENTSCDECKDEGFWWICPTFGARAYPYKTWKVSDLGTCDELDYYMPWKALSESALPEGWPDYYACNDRPVRVAKPSLLVQLGLGLKGIVRRI